MNTTWKDIGMKEYKDHPGFDAGSRKGLSMDARSHLKL